MPDRPRSAAQSLYPHLKSGARDVVERRDQPASVADALYPRPQAKSPSSSNWHRDLLLKHLRELNAKIDARLAREGRR
jgi:hypothetical protein